MGADNQLPSIEEAKQAQATSGFEFVKTVSSGKMFKLRHFRIRHSPASGASTP